MPTMPEGLAETFRSVAMGQRRRYAIHAGEYVSNILSRFRGSAAVRRWFLTLLRALHTVQNACKARRASSESVWRGSIFYQKAIDNCNKHIIDRDERTKTAGQAVGDDCARVGCLDRHAWSLCFPCQTCGTAHCSPLLTTLETYPAHWRRARRTEISLLPDTPAPATLAVPICAPLSMPRCQARSGAVQFARGLP